MGVRGILEERGEGWLRVRVGGVSLQMSVPITTVTGLGSIGEEVYLHTHLQVKDEEMVLHGFSTQQELHLFRMLLGVSGVGPKMALGLLSAREPQVLASAIAAGDIDALRAVPGLGVKSAGRIVLELKGRLAREVAEMPVPPGRDESEVVAALIALGTL